MKKDSYKTIYIVLQRWMKTVPYTDETGTVTVYESELKKMTEDDNITRYDAQLREYGIAEYSNATFDNINVPQVSGKAPRDLIPCLTTDLLLTSTVVAGKTTCCAIGVTARRGYSSGQRLSNGCRSSGSNGMTSPPCSFT